MQQRTSLQISYGSEFYTDNDIDYASLEVPFVGSQEEWEREQRYAAYNQEQMLLMQLNELQQQPENGTTR